MAVKLTVFLHIYYVNSALSFLQKIKHLQRLREVNFYININRAHPDSLRLFTILKTRYPGVLVICSSNKGKDIGGKLYLMDQFLFRQDTTDWFLWLHDKKSPQLNHGEKWSSELISVANESSVARVLRLQNDTKIGMIGNEKNLMTKSRFTKKERIAGNSALMTSMAARYELQNPDELFIGGTMFWVRAETFIRFFKRFPPLSIRAELEEGNVMDDFGPTVTHAWERLFGWIVTTRQLNIIGI